MWMLVGLGNPGRDYEKTRHNVGFDLVDLLSTRWNIRLDQANPLYVFGSGRARGEDVLLVKPLTFMNRSGAAVKRLLREPELSSLETLVIYDEIHLPLGSVRIRKKGSHGGHNGLRSIIETLQTQEIPRMRIGVGEPTGEWVDYVLSRFSDKEREVIDEALEHSADGIEAMLKAGIDLAMTRFNRNG
ncbi:MAG: aminoacyl-tRNA hydrolase [bacterium]|nr:aminoacyl-tRNA hydrolase [bacterium]